MRHLIHLVAFAAALGAAPDARSASITRRIVVDVAEDRSTFTELRARVDQKTGSEEVRLVITASAPGAPLAFDSARFMTDLGPAILELQHGRERLFDCPDVGCPEHALVAFDISTELLAEFVGEGEPWHVYLQKDGHTVKNLVVPAAAIADFLNRISVAHRQ